MASGSITGGVSHNQGMIKALEDVTEKKIGISKLDSMYAGAFSAAVYVARYAEECVAGYAAQI